MVETKRAGEKEYRAFLKERGLTRSFTIYQNLKGKRKFNIELSLSNFDGISRREKALLTREKDGVRIRDFITLQIIGSSKSKNFSTVIKELNEKKTVRLSIKGKDFEMKEPKIKIKNIIAYSSYNQALNRTRIHEYSKIPSRKMGHVVVKIRAKKGMRKWLYQKAHSSGGFNLRDSKQVKQAISEAVGNCFAALEFTPDTWELLDWWYGSYYDVKGSGGANV